MFHVGQVVECINARPGFATGEPVQLRKGARYIIESLDAPFRIRCVRVIGDLMWYSPCRFRPIVERKTDISVFNALLNPTPQRVRESIGYDLGFTKEHVGTS